MFTWSAAGAQLFLVRPGSGANKLGVSDAAGRFAVPAPRGEKGATLVARADRFGVGYVDLGEVAPAGDVDLRLVTDRPVSGRITDTQGRPIAGATVTVKHLGASGTDSLDKFLAQWKTRSPGGQPLEQTNPEALAPPTCTACHGANEDLPHGTSYLTLSSGELFPPVTTDAEGRFRMSGVGDDRLVGLGVGGAGVAEDEPRVVNRAGVDPKPYNPLRDKISLVPESGFHKWLLYGPGPSVVTEAEKPIRGVVKDKDTGPSRRRSIRRRHRLRCRARAGDPAGPPAPRGPGAEGRELRGRSVLFASLFEGASLSPALLLVPSDVLVGWESINRYGDWQFLETTMVATHDFDAACSSYINKFCATRSRQRAIVSLSLRPTDT